MKRVTGLGGIFFKTGSPKDITAWYQKHLGIEPDAHGGIVFEWRDRDQADRIGQTVFAPFKNDTNYFAPSSEPYMFNFLVEDMDALLEALRREGVQVVGDVQEFPYGKFAHILDPEGRKIELWQPVENEDGK